MTVTKPWRRVWPCETHTWCSPVTWDTWHLARQTFTLARHEPSVPASCHGHMVTIPVPVSSHMMAPLIRSHSRNHVVRTSSSAPLCKRLDSKLYLCDGESRMIMWESITWWNPENSDVTDKSHFMGNHETWVRESAVWCENPFKHLARLRSVDTVETVRLTWPS